MGRVHEPDNDSFYYCRHNDCACHDSDSSLSNDLDFDDDDLRAINIKSAVDRCANSLRRRRKH